MLGFNGGAIGADIYCDRTGILARTIADAAKVLDALKRPRSRLLRPARPVHDGAALIGAGDVLSRATRWPRGPGSLKGMRIGVIRESMLIRPGEKADRADMHRRCAARSRRSSARSSAPLLVESSDPLWERDRDLEAMKPDFRRALARLVPVFMPDLLFRLGTRRRAALQGIRRGDPADRVHARQGIRQRRRWRQSTIACELAEGGWRRR